MVVAQGMRGTRVAIGAETLRRLYVEERLTADAIAARLGCAGNTILRRLREFRIDARPRGPATRNFASEWTPEVAYTVGLIATDGCLSRDGRHLCMTSKDIDLLETVKRCLGVQTRITKNTGCYRLQWGSVRMFRWLCDSGLMPAKSLRLGPLRIPDDVFRDFFRGCIDGDGSIVTYIDVSNVRKHPAYVYRRLYVSLVSASRSFIDWIRTTLRRLVGVSGDVNVKRSEKHSDVWRIRYAKKESLTLLRWMYYADDLPCLRRKRDIAAPFLVRPTVPLQRRPGRPMVV
jgi:hypothetical protein